MKVLKCLFVVMIFLSGLAIGRITKPPVIKTVVKTEKVYSLPEGTTLQGLCDNFYGEEKEKIQKDMENWGEGYKEGFKKNRL